MTFQEKLDIMMQKNNSLVCVGLDADFSRLPDFLKDKDYPQFEFNKGIINATYHLVCAYKPNTAFYEALGDRGITQLKMTCDYLRSTYPEIPIILDAKRGDIENTNDGYVQFAFDHLGADAITLQPYCGKESLWPFIHKKDKGCIILCRTTNEGASEIQDLKINGDPLYLVIAKKVVHNWNEFNNCMLVIAANAPDEMKQVRNIAGDMTFLVPGVGMQGGDVERIVKAGMNDQSRGLIISSSRNIIFAGSDGTFAERAREETEKLREEINEYRY